MTSSVEDFEGDAGALAVVVVDELEVGAKVEVELLEDELVEGGVEVAVGADVDTGTLVVVGIVVGVGVDVVVGPAAGADSVLPFGDVVCAPATVGARRGVSSETTTTRDKAKELAAARRPERRLPFTWTTSS